MTQGSLWKNIFLFSMPLVLAQLLEVMFNLSDVAVVGQFADYRALGGSRIDDHTCNIIYRLSDRNGKRCQCTGGTRTWSKG